MARAKKSGSAGPSPDPDIYVSLLFVAVAALTAGIVFLVMELNNYAWTLSA